MDDRLYSKKHIWVSQTAEIVTLGITDFAQDKLGTVMFLNLPDVGEHLKIGKRFGDIESIKTVSDLISPVEGEVVKINEGLVDEPDMINDRPYTSWFVEVKVVALSDELMNEEAYLSQKEEL